MPSDVPLQDRRLGKAGKALADPAGAGVADPLDRLQVFDGGAVPSNLKLLEPPTAGPAGIVHLRYGLAEGVPGTGDMASR